MADTRPANAVPAILAALHHMELHRLPSEDAYQVELHFTNGQRYLTPITFTGEQVENRHTPSAAAIMADIVHSALRSGARVGAPWVLDTVRAAQYQPEPAWRQKPKPQPEITAKEFDGILKAVYSQMPMERSPYAVYSFAEWAEDALLDQQHDVEREQAASAMQAERERAASAAAAEEAAAIEADVLAALEAL